MMKKSSLGRRSSTAHSMSRKTSDFIDKGSRSGIPMPSSCVPPRKRDASNDRVSDYGSTQSIPASCGTLRTPRSMTMSSGRPSSIGNSKKVDNRPLLDRGWQIRAIEMIHSALSMDQEGCDILESSRSLKPMTLLNFVNISNYFVKKLGSTTGVNKVNYITELVYLLKKLQYKGKVDKSMLQTVNTMHNWPHALGILQFLAMLAQASEDFAKLGLDPLYPDFLELDTQQDEKLNFKSIIPVLHHLWDQANSKKEDTDIETLVKDNEDIVYQALASSGWTEDVFAQENEARMELEAAEREYQEFQEKFNRLDQQYNGATEKLGKLESKVETERAAIDALNAKLQEQMDMQADLERQISYNEEECKMKQDLLDCYDADDKELTQEQYEAYCDKKKTILQNIIIEKDCLYQLTENHFDEKVKTSQLESSCASLFKEFNQLISEVIKEDVSIRGAICYTRPKIGTTPCNEATAQLLTKTLTAYEQRIAQMEAELNKSDLTDEFTEEEEIKTKMAMLEQLKHIHTDAIAEHQQVMTNLQKELVKVNKENQEVNEELQITEEELKKNHQEYEELESEIKLKEERLKKFHDICQRKLELRHKSIVELDRKMQMRLDELATQAKRVLAKLKS